ncbi:MAG: DUF378 domain-containing protein [Bacilli bacterium]|nr:DUF378 domain-containing protein [Bacilli bacterium]
MENLQKVLLVITIIGAINWGLVGLFDFNLVSTLFGEGTMLSRIIYVAIALCGLFNIGILLEHFDSKKD